MTKETSKAEDNSRRNQRRWQQNKQKRTRNQQTEVRDQN